jgi:lipid II:glycine glycyltransferase (peptidoglycan interpeptide bridge formation enzyme)
MVELIYSDDDFKSLLPIVATKEFLSSKSDKFGWFINDDFILPYIIEQKFIFKRLIFAYSIIKKNNKDISQKEFLNNVVKLSKTLNIDFIYQPYAFAIFEEVPDNSIFIPFGTYQVDLTKSEDELFKNLHSKHRNVIRKAQKNGLVISIGAKEEVYNLIKDTLLRQHQPYMSRVALDNLEDKLKENIIYYSIKNNNKIEGSAIIIYNKYEAYYLLAGSSVKTSAGAMNLLVWQIMLDMKEKGVQRFDFVGARINPQAGSKFEGIQRFKSRFGSELKIGYLWKIPIKPFKYKLFRFVTWAYYKLKNKAYMGDIIDQELRNVK